MHDEPQQLLQGIAEQVRACTACPLHGTRTHAVPGEGPPDARVVFIGEAPGADEDKQGRPFVGRSGQLLRRTIVEVGWREDEVFIGNVLKCRPPNNRDPLDSEIACCRHYLFAQLALLRPRIVVTLGRYSMQLLINPKLQITADHGQHMTRDGQLYLPTFHPSYILRDMNQLPLFKRDLMKAKKLSEIPEASAG
jgi:uracil-DNA glycosylase